MSFGVFQNCFPLLVVILVSLGRTDRALFYKYITNLSPYLFPARLRTLNSSSKQLCSIKSTDSSLVVSKNLYVSIGDSAEILDL